MSFAASFAFLTENHIRFTYCYKGYTIVKTESNYDPTALEKSCRIYLKSSLGALGSSYFEVVFHWCPSSFEASVRLIHFAKILKDDMCG